MGFITIKIRQIIVHLVSSVCLWLLGLQRARFPWSSLNPTIAGRFFTIWATRKAPLRQIAVKSFQSCPTLCDPIDVSPPGSPAPRILQARKLEWVAISLSNAWKWKSESEVAQSCLTQQPQGLQPTRLLHPWDFPGKSTGVGLLWNELINFFKKCKSLVMK